MLHFNFVVASKRRKGRPSALAEEEEASSVEQRPSYSTVASISSDMKISSIYNRSVTEAPAEVIGCFVKTKVPTK